MFQTELQVKPTFGQLGPMPGSASLDPIQGNLFPPERGAMLTQVPSKDAKGLGN